MEDDRAAYIEIARVFLFILWLYISLPELCFESCCCTYQALVFLHSKRAPSVPVCRSVVCLALFCSGGRFFISIILHRPGQQLTPIIQNQFPQNDLRRRSQRRKGCSWDRYSTLESVGAWPKPSLAFRQRWVPLAESFTRCLLEWRSDTPHQNMRILPTWGRV